jgi:hypothetical protein
MVMRVKSVRSARKSTQSCLSPQGNNAKHIEYNSKECFEAEKTSLPT